MTSLPQYDLCLADGTCWVIAAGDEAAVPVVDLFAKTMSLPEHASPGRFLWVFSDERLVQQHEGELCHIFEPAPDRVVPYIHFKRLSYDLGCRMLEKGGVLLHGALAEYNPGIAQEAETRQGVGMIMTASSGTGKTTASARLRSPWRSLCDDLTLVVRGSDGNYWAHPWPTWSRFQGNGPRGVWNTPRAVPLAAIFIMKRNQCDYFEEIRQGQSVFLLLEAAKQAVYLDEYGKKTDQLRALRLTRFNNLCAIAKAVSVRILHFSADGMFWEEMEKAFQKPFLEENCACNQSV